MRVFIEIIARWMVNLNRLGLINFSCSFEIITIKLLEIIWERFWLKRQYMIIVTVQFWLSFRFQLNFRHKKKQLMIKPCPSICEKT